MATIRKHGNKWRVDFSIGTNRQRPKFDTKAEAEAFKRELLLRPIDKMIGFKKSNNATINDLIAKYKSTVTVTKSPETQKLEHSILNEFLETFAQRNILDVGLQDLEAYQVKLRERLAAETVNRHFNSIRHFFSKCLDWDYINDSPTRRLKNLKSDTQKTPTIYTNEEVAKVMRLAYPWLADTVYFLASTGIRRKEIVNLRWQSVDFTLGVFHIEAGEGFHPKGYKPRTIPLSANLRDFLMSKKEAAMEHGKHRPKDFVFLNSVWHPIHPKQLTTALHRLKAKTGLGKLNPHSFRHTALTNLAAMGTSGGIIQKVAGHSNSHTTERYIHLVSDDLRESMAKLSETAPKPQSFTTSSEKHGT